MIYKNVQSYYAIINSNIYFEEIKYLFNKIIYIYMIYKNENFKWMHLNNYFLINITCNNNTNKRLL